MTASWTAPPFTRRLCGPILICCWPRFRFIFHWHCVIIYTCIRLHCNSLKWTGLFYCTSIAIQRMYDLCNKLTYIVVLYIFSMHICRAFTDGKSGLKTWRIRLETYLGPAKLWFPQIRLKHHHTVCNVFLNVIIPHLNMSSGWSWHSSAVIYNPPQNHWQSVLVKNLFIRQSRKQFLCLWFV
jgi:hypothetical protein